MLTPEQAVLVSILTCMAGAALTLLAARNKVVAGWLAFLVTGGTAFLILSAVFQVLTPGPRRIRQSSGSCRGWDSPSASTWMD